MPRRSRYIAATVGERARWGDLEHLTADVVDLLNVQLYQFAAFNSKRRPSKPKPIRRPGVDPQGERKLGTARMTVTQARKYLDRFKAKGDPSGS